MSEESKKSQAKVELEHIQADLKEQLQLAYSKINTEMERIMGPNLKQCIDRAAND